MALVELVPNISVGNNPALLASLIGRWQSIKGLKILHIDVSPAANRTVLTAAGDPEVILQAAFTLIKASAELIDMRQQQGIHPRIGAVDVCPFIPLEGCSLEEAVQWAYQLGERVGQELGLSGYYYAAAAKRPERERLADLRRGEYESLPTRVGQEFWRPDFGPDQFNPQFGMVAIGARRPLIAYNIDLNTANVRAAQEIAGLIRTSGTSKGSGAAENGGVLKFPGKFPALQAIGWMQGDFGHAQVSMNVLDYAANSLAAIYQEVQRLAAERGVQVLGSELVGLLPQAALTEAGAEFLRVQNAYPVRPPAELIKMAAEALGLDRHQFSARQILENALAHPLNDEEIKARLHPPTAAAPVVRQGLAVMMAAAAQAAQLLRQLCEQAYQAWLELDPADRPSEDVLPGFGEQLLAMEEAWAKVVPAPRPTTMVAQGMSFLDQATTMMDVVEGLLVQEFGQSALLGQSLYLLAASIEGAALEIRQQVSQVAETAFAENIKQELDVMLDNFHKRFYPALQTMQGQMSE